MSETAYRRPESVLVVVYSKAGELLLIKRRQPVDFWQSVTGSLEPDESPEQAAVRELAEETGIRGAALINCHKTFDFDIKPHWARRYAPGVTVNTEHWFLCELTKKPHAICLAADEHTDYRWLPATEALSVVASHSNRVAIEEFVLKRLDR